MPVYHNWETQDYIDNYVCFIRMTAKEGHFVKGGNNSPECLLNADGLHCSLTCLTPVGM